MFYLTHQPTDSMFQLTTFPLPFLYLLLLLFKRRSRSFRRSPLNRFERCTSLFRVLRLVIVMMIVERIKVGRSGGDWIWSSRRTTEIPLTRRWKRWSRRPRMVRRGVSESSRWRHNSTRSMWYEQTEEAGRWRREREKEVSRIRRDSFLSDLEIQTSLRNVEDGKLEQVRNSRNRKRKRKVRDLREVSLSSRNNFLSFEKDTRHAPDDDETLWSSWVATYKLYNLIEVRIR
jgi:hypothetical protein